MPSLLHYPGLFVLALLPLASLGLYSGDISGDFSETSGGDLQNEAHAPDHKWLSIARQMRRDIASVRDEQFKRDFAETRNMTEYAFVRLETPLLSSADGCLPPDFTAHKCLRRIYSGLRVYQIYLPYVERENLTKAHMVNIKFGTTRLLHFIKETGRVNDDKAHPISLSELPSDSAWTRKTVTHSILYNFADFMTDAIRAMNYMKIKKLMKFIVKEDWWLPKHTVN